MGSNPVLLTINMEHDCPPALGVRHDVDILMWQINQNENSDFEIKHKGTLHAFGYIQVLLINIILYIILNNILF